MTLGTALKHLGRFAAGQTSFQIVDHRTGEVGRGRGRRRTRRVTSAGAALAAIVLLAACGESSYDMGALANNIRSALDNHPGFSVRSVHCPQHAKQAKGVVIRCSATLRTGHVVKLRATQLDDHGTIHLVANEIFADNVERAILADLPRGTTSPRADCPNHVPVVIGDAFTCDLRHAGRYSKAQVTIIDGDGGFRLSFS